MSAAEILRALVAVPTPSAVSNVPLMDAVTARLAPLGWHCVRQNYTDENGIAKANLIARPVETDAEIGLAFVCHTDTVPYAAEWADALTLTPSADGAALHGCGACDVKGALACFLAAVDVVGSKIRSDVALLLTADEEIGCKGMERLLDATELKIRAALVSEPTNLRLGVAGKGYGLARVTVRGAEAHSAFPAKGVSAIAHAAKMIARLEASAGAGTANALFEPAHTTVNVGMIEGGTAKNIVAGECRFLVEWRPIPEENPRAMLKRLETLAVEIEREEPRVRVEVEGLRADVGFAPASAGALQQRLAELLGPERRPTGISFGSEASRLARVADEVIVIGPGDMQTAHSARECVPVAELEEWTGALRELLSE